MHDSEQNEKKSSRSGFLRQLGVTLAAAVGAGALAARANAYPGECCRDCNQCTSCDPPGGGPGCYCWCDCTGIGQSYCMTFSDGCRGTHQACTFCPC